jgi:hypothetical protein
MLALGISNGLKTSHTDNEEKDFFHNKNNASGTDTSLCVAQSLKLVPLASKVINPRIFFGARHFSTSPRFFIVPGLVTMDTQDADSPTS